MYSKTAKAAAAAVTTASMTRSGSIFQEPLHILGSGSIGLLWIASIRSSFPSYPITLLLRSHHKPKINMNRQINITLTRQHSGQLPDRIPVPVQVIEPSSASCTTSPSTTPIQNLIVSTKSYQAASAVKTVFDQLDVSASCRIIILCNGAMSVRDELNGWLMQHNKRDQADENLSTTERNDCSRYRLVLATTTNGVYQELQEPKNNDDMYRIVHAGLGKTFIEFPEEEDNVESKRIKDITRNPDKLSQSSSLSALATLWDNSGLNCTSISTSDMNILLWKKLAANCAINPLTSLFNCHNGELLLEPSVPELIHEVTAEVSQVAHAIMNSTNGDDDFKQSEKNNQHHHSFHKQLSQQEISAFVYQVIRDTLHNKSSMLQDVTKKQHTEIDHLNGYIVRKGRTLGIECPVNEDLCHRIRELTTSTES